MSERITFFFPEKQTNNNKKTPLSLILSLEYKDFFNSLLHLKEKKKKKEQIRKCNNVRTHGTKQFTGQLKIQLQEH